MAKGFEQLIDQIGGMTVLELADFVKAIEEKFGVSAAVPMAAATGAAQEAGAVAQEEKSTFKVTLKEAGAKKIDVIKALRQVTPLSLTDAKNAVEGAPYVIGDAVSKDDAKKMKEVLEAAGAKVELA